MQCRRAGAVPAANVAAGSSSADFEHVIELPLAQLSGDVWPAREPKVSIGRWLNIHERVRFATDSVLEEGVMSELVSESQIPC